MCTLTVSTDSERFLVTMNRDEARTRAEELPPEVSRPPDAPALVRPLDGKARGTWIGANDRGLVAALLNLYDAEDPEASPPRPGGPSRGELVPLLLRCLDLDGARARLAGGLDATRYPPFRLAVFSFRGGVSVRSRGDGRLELEEHAPGPAFLSSSSWRPEEVIPWRRERFEEWRAAGGPRRGPLPEFHLLRPEGREAWAPLLARDRASTRSIVQVEVDLAAATATMRYWPRPEPDLDPSRDVVEVPLPLIETGRARGR